MTSPTMTLSLETRMSLIRTRLSLERTLMSWIRTSVSLISFGFTIYKAFQFLAEEGARRTSQPWLGPREFALIMICLGVICLLLATIQHWRHVRDMHKIDSELPVFSVAALLAYLFSGLGILALVAVALRH